MALNLPALPPLPAYPSEPGQERDEWHRLAALHLSAASAAATEALAAANQALAAATTEAAKAQAAVVEAYSQPDGAPDLSALVAAAKALREIRDTLST